MDAKTIGQILQRLSETQANLPIEALTGDEREALRLAASQLPGYLHRCSGCGFRWNERLPGVELCGDCWWKGQAAILVPVPAETEKD